MSSRVTYKLYKFEWLKQFTEFNVCFGVSCVYNQLYLRYFQVAPEMYENNQLVVIFNFILFLILNSILVSSVIFCTKWTDLTCVKLCCPPFLAVVCKIGEFSVFSDVLLFVVCLFDFQPLHRPQWFILTWLTTSLKKQFENYLFIWSAFKLP